MPLETARIESLARIGEGVYASWIFWTKNETVPQTKSGTFMRPTTA